MPRKAAAKHEDHEEVKQDAKHDEPALTLDKDHRDHLGVDHREGPVDPPERTDHLTGYPEPEAPVEPPEGSPQQGVDNLTRDGVQIPVDPE